MLSSLPTNARRCRQLSRLVAFYVALFVCAEVSNAQSFRTKLVLATYRLEHPRTSGTGFLVRQPTGDKGEVVLATAAHTFHNMDGDQANILLRQQSKQAGWTPVPFRFAIRANGKPLWTQHAKQDVAAIRLTLPEDLQPDTISVGQIATKEDWKKGRIEPGGFARVVGFPHASQFRPSPAGFPLTRLGAIASFPLLPLEKHATFLVDYNAFEGDSGGPVYIEPESGKPKVFGLIHGQHFLDERYELIYQRGHIRKRLGLAIVVNSQAILDTINAIADQPPKGK